MQTAEGSMVVPQSAFDRLHCICEIHGFEGLICLHSFLRYEVASHHYRPVGYVEQCFDYSSATGFQNKQIGLIRVLALFVGRFGSTKSVSIVRTSDDTRHTHSTGPSHIDKSAGSPA